MGCDIWEKWVSGWVGEEEILKHKNTRWDMGKVGCDIWEKWVGGRTRNTSKVYGEGACTESEEARTCDKKGARKRKEK